MACEAKLPAPADLIRRALDDVCVSVGRLEAEAAAARQQEEQALEDGHPGRLAVARGRAIEVSDALARRRYRIRELEGQLASLPPEPFRTEDARPDVREALLEVDRASEI